jgi:hypothetical protein
MVAGASPLVGSGRCGSPAVFAKNAKVPVLPTLSLHVPAPVAGLTTADTCTGLADGASTIEKFNVTLPLALNDAWPTALAWLMAPHWLSVPSRVYPVGVFVRVSVTTLQYGCICHEKVPSTWASADDAMAIALRQTRNDMSRCIQLS